MDHLNYTTKRAKSKHLNYEDRIKIVELSMMGDTFLRKSCQMI